MEIQTSCYRAGLRAGVTHPTHINRSPWPLGFVFSLLLLAASAANVAASDPAGVYAFVDKVVFEPDQKSPERIQVWGGFALASGSGNTYADARRGYMYFEAASGKESVIRKEWNDLQTLAGSGQIVAFGSRWRPNGTIRNADAKPAKPDTYQVEMGLVKVTDPKDPNRRADYKPVKELRALQAATPIPKAPPAETKSKS